ncbi:Csac_0668 family 2Fe-2S cluster-binding (seleno)protein [Acidaminobacter hydrogenoformans]|uniref:BFD-like [2Fe-2S] binding domain-containing protein n=1 Tax=Acidaminobacter hydrogenoformans DSM 2784 TaxID=1120920 RepID=A0A1G5RXU0_9FIRM|nr:copper chaperone Copz family protein [Acidaminobacter hydrogenoformans]SCZ78737.1 BFD-like [2Fe-2S] binding domain-containing protein [Acidaminobacter hydrogenoformans DSM 2784]
MKIFGQAALKIEPCPLCGKSGRPVGGITVRHLLLEAYREEATSEAYFMCMNEDCDVVYYETDGATSFTKQEIEVPIWFKRDANPRYACYCSHVTVEDVMDAVIHQGARTVSEVNRLTGAMKNANCKLNNPLGVCCHGVIQDVIDQGFARLKTGAE